MPARKPAVAGSFYPSDPKELSDLIKDCFKGPVGPGRQPPAPRGNASIVSVVCPHAGYVYSGPVAAHSYLHVSSLPDPDILAVISPNHYGIGSGISTFKEGEWETPLGSLKVDSEATRRLSDEYEEVQFDPRSQSAEHSLEVQLPFLQHLYGSSVPLLPVCMLFQDEDTARTLGKAVAKVLKGRRAVLVASSDLTHYEPAAAAREKDTALLTEALKMDLPSFYSALERLQVTACGYGPIAAVMEASKELGLKKAELLKYATSGDTAGDNLQVVGYGSLRFV